MWCSNNWSNIGLICFIVIGLAAITVLLISNRMSISKRTKNETAIEIAEKRYARGEITKGQFDSFKTELFKSNQKG